MLIYVCKYLLHNRNFIDFQTALLFLGAGGAQPFPVDPEDQVY